MLPSSSILGSLSDIFVWMLIFALPIVVMTILHMYLSLRRGSIEYGYLAGTGLFLLLQLVLVGGIQPIPTLLFVGLLYPAAIKTLISVIRDANRERKGDFSGAGGTMVKIVTSGFRESSGVGETCDSDDDRVDVLLIKDHGDLRGVSALLVNPATSVVQPQSCVTLLTTLSKFSKQQNRRNALEWVFKVDVPQNGSGADYKFMVVVDGKLKKGKEDESEGRLVELVRVATVYLRSALRSIGLVEEDEVSAISAMEILKRMNKDDDGAIGDRDGEGREFSLDVVAVRGLPKKIVEVEQEIDPFSSSRNSSSSSAEFTTAFLQHPVGGLVRLMIADGITGSYVVHFKRATPPEAVSAVDESLLDAAMLAASGVSGRVGDRYVRGPGAKLSFQTLMRSNVAGRLRLADGENLAEEAVSGVRRGYWNVEAYVAIRKTEKRGKCDGNSSSPSAVVKVASALVSCFSGGARSVDAKILEDEGGCCRLVGEYPLEMVTSPHGKGLASAVGTGEMSSDSLASFITLSPPYPVPASDASLLAEFEIPPGDGNRLGNGDGNGLLHLGRAYFRGTPAGDVKINIEDLSMHLDILGETGYGKTRLVADLLRQLWELDPTINWLIMDLKGEYYNQLQQHIGERIDVLITGGDVNDVRHDGVGIPLRVDLLNDGRLSDHCDESAKNERTVRLFSALKESLAGLFKENTEFSPMMERILFESLKQVMATAGNLGDSTEGDTSSGGFFDSLFHEVESYVIAHKRRDTVMSGEALKNRLERFRRGAIRDVLNHNPRNNKMKGCFPSPDFREMIRTKKVIIDLSGCVRKGCSKEDIRLLLNLITSVIFEETFKKGLVGAPALRHLTVIEEANILVPDVLRRKTMGDLASTEDMILTARGFGEGLILLAQRPTISSFVLANAGTKVVFRSPFDASKVAEFMGLNEEQQNAVKSLRKFEAVGTTVQGGPYKISTAKPQQLSFPTLQMGHRQHKSAQAPRSTSSSFLPQVASKPAVTEVTKDEDPSVEDTSNTSGGEDNVVVDEGDIKRLLKRRGVSSDRFKLFGTVASSSSHIKVPDAILSVFGGEEQRYLDALGNLTDTAVWTKLLVTVDDCTIRLTEYGRKVWISIQQNKEKRRRGING